MIDWINFTPWTALGGGLRIGLAAALVLCNDRIAGISGILGGLLRPARGDVGWRVAFLAGLMAAPVLSGLIAALPEVKVDAGAGTLVARWFARWCRNPVWGRLHKRPRRMWHLAHVGALADRHGDVHVRWFRHGLHRPPRTHLKEMTCKS